MKDHEQEVNQQQQVALSGNPAISDGPRANNNGHETNELGRGRGEIAAEASGKRTVSSSKVEANRRNARKSTGPRTAIGKKRVSRNAIRHGFFAKGLLVQHRDGKEDPAEYNDLYFDVRKHYQPVGWLEELRVEEIAVLSWRRRRPLRWESGMIAKALAERSYQLQQSEAGDLAEPESVLSSNQEMDAMTDHLFLPEKEELDKLLRYEAMINRQLNHARIGEGAGAQEGRVDGGQYLSIFAKQSQEVL